MKCFWPFIGRKGKVDLCRSKKKKKPSFEPTKSSYKSIATYGEPLPPESREQQKRIRSPPEEVPELSPEDRSQESSTRSSRSELDERACENPTEGNSSENGEAPPESNRKKQGVSGQGTVAGEPEKASDIRLPKYEKDPESEEIIKAAIKDNEFLKNGLFACTHVIQAVVDAMYLKRVPAKTHVIREGEVGSHMYVCAEGTIDVYKKSVKVNTLGPGKLFGELALLYNSKRNATILATTPCKFWVLERNVFLQIMKKSGMQMTENRVKFLRSIPFLSGLDTEVLVKMTEILKLRSYPGDSVIIKQGDEGSLFYIITGGFVSVTIAQPDGTIKKGQDLKAGDFFGEGALLRGEKRGATVTAQPPAVECLTLDKVHFLEYLGGLEEVQSVNFEEKIPVEETQESEYSQVSLTDLDIVGTLGVGAFGRVELAQLKQDKNTVFALKCVKKVDVVDLGQQEHMLNEKENMMICRSPFVIRMYNTYKSSKYLYFLMEYCPGGDVWSLLQKRRFFDESLAKFTTACMVEAFDYLHARGIAYRDLKPENVLYDTKGYAKLADFGFSKKLGPTMKTWTFVGTPEYMAPEIILNEGHNRAADYWTLGIFVHELLVGKPPFRGHNNSVTFTLILKGIDKVDFPRHVSKTAQFLIRKLCRRTPAERLGYQREGVTGIKRHKWFQNFDWDSLQKTTMKAPYKPKLNNVTDLSNFDKYYKEKDIPPDDFGDWDAKF